MGAYLQPDKPTYQNLWNGNWKSDLYIASAACSRDFGNRNGSWWIDNRRNFLCTSRQDSDPPRSECTLAIIALSLNSSHLQIRNKQRQKRVKFTPFWYYAYTFHVFIRIALPIMRTRFFHGLLHLFGRFQWTVDEFIPGQLRFGRKRTHIVQLQ